MITTRKNVNVPSLQSSSKNKYLIIFVNFQNLFAVQNGIQICCGLQAGPNS
jgi:hypothetical protein